MPPVSLPESIESDRLLIRVARPGDGAVLNAAVVASGTELAPWMPWVHPLPSVADSERVCRRAHARWLLDEDLMALLWRKSDGLLIGVAGLHNIDWALHQFEVGYWGRTDQLGQGYVSEGARALADHALTVLKANRVVLRTDARNVASCRLAERVGFELEGTLRRDRPGIDGQLCDTRVYSRLA